MWFPVSRTNTQLALVASENILMFFNVKMSSILLYSVRGARVNIQYSFLLFQKKKKLGRLFFHDNFT